MIRRHVLAGHQLHEGDSSVATQQPAGERASDETRQPREVGVAHSRRLDGADSRMGPGDPWIDLDRGDVAVHSVPPGRLVDRHAFRQLQHHPHALDDATPSHGAQVVECASRFHRGRQPVSVR